MLIQGRLRKRLRHPHGWCCRQTAWPAVFVAAAASSFLKDVGGQKSARRIRYLQQIRRFRATAEFKKDYARWSRSLLAQQNIESSVFSRCRDRLPSNVIRGEPSRPRLLFDQIVSHGFQAVSSEDPIAFKGGICPNFILALDCSSRFEELRAAAFLVTLMTPIGDDQIALLVVTELTAFLRNDESFHGRTPPVASSFFELDSPSWC